MSSESNILWKRFDTDSYNLVIDCVRDNIADGRMNEAQKKQAERLLYLLISKAKKGAGEDGTPCMTVDLFNQTARDLIDNLVWGLLRDKEDRNEK